MSEYCPMCNGFEAEIRRLTAQLSAATARASELDALVVKMRSGIKKLAADIGRDYDARCWEDDVLGLLSPEPKPSDEGDEREPG